MNIVRGSVAFVYLMYANLLILAFAGELVSLYYAVVICLALHVTGLLFSLVVLRSKFGWDFTYPVKGYEHAYAAFDAVQFVALVAVLALNGKYYAAEAAAAAIALVGVVLCLVKVAYLFNKPHDGNLQSVPQLNSQMQKPPLRL